MWFNLRGRPLAAQDLEQGLPQEDTTEARQNRLGTKEVAVKSNRAKTVERDLVHA